MRLVVISAFAGLAGCVGGPCIIGDEIRVDAYVAAPTSVMGTTAVFCINRLCSGGTLETPSDTASMDYYPAALKGDFDTNVFADANIKPGLVDFQLYVPAADPTTESLVFTDGDVYSLTMVDGAGDLLIDASEAVTYGSYGAAHCETYKTLDLQLYATTK